MEDTEREAEILKQEGTKKQKRKRILTTRGGEKLQAQPLIPPSLPLPKIFCSFSEAETLPRMRPWKGFRIWGKYTQWEI